VGYCIEFAGPHEGVARRVTVQSSGREVAHSNPLLPLQPRTTHLARQQRVLIAMTFTGRAAMPVASRGGGGVRNANCRDPCWISAAAAARCVRELRAAGVENFRIELRRAEIEASLKDDVKPSSRSTTASCNAVPRWPIRERVCTEVLEHIPDYVHAAKEMARVARLALITVPDMSAIPHCFRTVPAPGTCWKRRTLISSPQASLELLLRRFFANVSFHASRRPVNGTQVFTSLVARCER